MNGQDLKFEEKGKGFGGGVMLFFARVESVADREGIIHLDARKGEGASSTRSMDNSVLATYNTY